MFDYCSGIFIILFLWGHRFFLPFPFSLPQFTFTLLPLLQSSAGNALFSPQEFYDSLTECWDTKHSSSAGKDCGTGLTNRDTKTLRNEEREMEMERWGPNFTTCYLKLFPNVTGSAHLASRGVICTCSAQLCSDLRVMSYISHVKWFTAVLQHLFSVFPRVDMHFFGPISTQVTGADGIVHPRLISFSAITLQS